MVLVVATIIKHNASLCCNYNMYCNHTKKLFPRPIATPLIATTTNESDFVAIIRYCHKYGPISSLQHVKILVVETEMHICLRTKASWIPFIKLSPTREGGCGRPFM
jgi:hypothetical protein